MTWTVDRDFFGYVHYKINLFIFSFFEVNIRYKCHGKV